LYRNEVMGFRSVGGASAGRRWLHRPSCRRGDSMMAHREIGPLLTLQKKRGEGLIQCTETNAQNSLELNKYFNTPTPTCFGPLWFIIRELMGAQGNR